MYRPKGYEDGTIRVGVRYLRTVVTKLVCLGGGVDPPAGDGIVSSQKRPDWLWGTPSLLFNVYRRQSEA